MTMTNTAAVQMVETTAVIGSIRSRSDSNMTFVMVVFSPRADKEGNDHLVQRAQERQQ